MARFLAWLDDQVGRSGRLTEIGAAIKLESSAANRATQRNQFRHHRRSGAERRHRPLPARPSNKCRIETGTLLLIDSGGQYSDGTTDITRTVAIGAPTAGMRQHFTLVLKGHIAVAVGALPQGHARQSPRCAGALALWREGLDYDHGTGHGWAAILSVHEGPQSLSKREAAELEPGMILSNEPGYYRTGEYGIRIENLILVTKTQAIPGGDRPMMGFETLTLAPIDRRLIDVACSRARRARGSMHITRKCGARSAPLLKSDDRPWLRHATAPIR